jgi:hypothetical protein
MRIDPHGDQQLWLASVSARMTRHGFLSRVLFTFYQPIYPAPHKKKKRL